jgi:hypothetical protein
MSTGFMRDLGGLDRAFFERNANHAIAMLGASGFLVCSLVLTSGRWLVGRYVQFWTYTNLTLLYKLKWNGGLNVDTRNYRIVQASFD